VNKEIKVVEYPPVGQAMTWQPEGQEYKGVWKVLLDVAIGKADVESIYFAAVWGEVDNIEKLFSQAVDFCNVDPKRVERWRYMYSLTH